MGKKKQVGQIDLATGEVLDGVVAYLPRKVQNGFVGGWNAMSRAAYKVLKTFTRGEDFRVLMALLEELEYENKITCTQAKIAKDLGMQPSHVSRAIRRLLEAGVIVKGDKHGVSFFYYLNPSFGWKGSAENHVKALDDYRRGRFQPKKESVEEPQEPKPDPT